MEIELNGLSFTLDNVTGGIVQLAHLKTATCFLKEKEAPRWLDLALPRPEYPPYRLSSAGAKASITQTEDKATICWESLAPNAKDLKAKVRAEVTLSSRLDGRSVSVQARVENQSNYEVLQVIFPDLMGLQPTAGEADTRVVLGEGIVRPFRDLKSAEDTTPFFVGAREARFIYNALGTPFNMKWFDYGGLEAGLSVYSEDWTFDAQSLICRLPEVEPPRLRLSWEHLPEIAPGCTWESPVFVLTPHAGDWQDGIAAYRQFARSHPLRDPSVHIRAGLGFRTVWLLMHFDRGPFFRFRDMPDLAREAKEHGLEEMVLWFWCEHFQVPTSIPKALGTQEELKQALDACRDLGVNVSFFVSYLTLTSTSMKPEWRACLPGGTPAFQSLWTYNEEFVPRFNPTYFTAHEGALVDWEAPGWQEAVLADIDRILKMGIYSITWDQYIQPPFSKNPKSQPSPFRTRHGIHKMGREILRRCREYDSRATFSGEGHCDLHAQFLCYTWEWNNPTRTRLGRWAPYRSVFKTTRVNVNIGSSIRGSLRAFADGAFINVMPQAGPGRPNATGWISQYPELSATLRRLATLRKRFLRYFTEGEYLVGRGLRAIGGVFARLWGCTPDLLLILVNDTDEPQRLDLELDPKDATGVHADRYRLRLFDAEGHQLEESAHTGLVEFQREMAPDELVLIELRPE